MLRKILSELKTFEIPSLIDEQYPTDPEIAFKILNEIVLRNENNKVFADLGAGTGILGIGALLIGAEKVYFVEKDKNAIKILKNNLEIIKKYVEINGKYEILNCDVNEFKTKVDVVIMNPPFGTKKKHADRIFYDVAFEIADVVYSITKRTTSEFLLKYALKKNFLGKVLFNDNHLIRSQFKFHKSRTKFIDVSIIRFEKNRKIKRKLKSAPAGI